MENFTSFNFGVDNNSGSRSDILIQDSLSKISTEEMRSFVDRINFYIRHFDVLTRKNTVYASDSKITFLKRLKTVLLGEIDCRKVSI